MKRITVLLAMLICFNAWGADEWDKSDPAGSESPSDLDSLITTNNEVIDRLLKNYQEGAKISYASASTLTVATGEVVCSNSTGALRKFRSNTSAVTVIWGMIDTGAEASSTTYYLYAVADADATTFTVEISLSSSAPTGATYYARLGSFYNNSDSDILNDETIVNDNNVYALQLGDWLSRSASTTYEATTDGFVVVYQGAAGANEVVIYTDSDNPPTTKRSSDSTQSGDVSAFSPVKKGDYWKITTSGGAATSRYYWIPNE